MCNNIIIIFVFFQKEWSLRKSSDMPQFVSTDTSTDSERASWPEFFPVNEF